MTTPSDAARPASAAFEPRVVTAPALRLDAATVAAFERLLADWLQGGGGPLGHALDYELDVPRHLFLRWLVEARGYLLHGSNRADIDLFVPRDQTDAVQRHVRAVFATADGLWPMYFAIVDRGRPRVSLRNACWVTPDGERRYYFAVDDETLRGRHFVTGTVYVLPRDGFTRCLDLDGEPTEEWLSPDPVSPLGRIAVAPEDFPYLADVTGYDATAAFHAIELMGVIERSATSVRADGAGIVFALRSDMITAATDLVAALPSLELHGVTAVIVRADAGVELRVAGAPASLAMLRAWGARSE